MREKGEELLLSSLPPSLLSPSLPPSSHPPSLLPLTFTLPPTLPPSSHPPSLLPPPTGSSTVHALRVHVWRDAGAAGSVPGASKLLQVTTMAATL